MCSSGTARSDPNIESKRPKVKGLYSCTGTAIYLITIRTISALIYGILYAFTLYLDFPIHVPVSSCWLINFEKYFISTISFVKYN